MDNDSLTEARATNTKLHRRVQALEGPVQSEIALLKQERDAWAVDWKHTFNRLSAAHQELKLCYEEAARVTGAPSGRFHSVMDWRFEPPANKGEVYANMFIPGGVHSVRVVDEVKKAIQATKYAPWWRRLVRG